jgi:contractile injection system tube protein/LysM domain-containing protein
MPDPVTLAKAQLIEMESDFQSEKQDGKKVTVQFNPETLKVSFANQVAPSTGAGDQSGSAPMQFVGAGTTKLALQLWFDVTAQLSQAAMPDGAETVDDVRKLTQEVAYFITPQPSGNQFIPPAVRFSWGTFLFEGIMESLEESLEFFSNEGRPLRASVSINLTKQKITQFGFGEANNPSSPNPGRGRRPLTQAAAGSTLQGLASSLGKGDNWQAIAEANGIENPRMLQPGQLIDMNVSLPQPGRAANLTVPPDPATLPQRQR